MIPPRLRAPGLAVLFTFLAAPLWAGNGTGASYPRLHLSTDMTGHEAAAQGLLDQDMDISVEVAKPLTCVEALMPEIASFLGEVILVTLNDGTVLKGTLENINTENTQSLTHIGAGRSQDNLILNMGPTKPVMEIPISEIHKISLGDLTRPLVLSGAAGVSTGLIDTEAHNRQVVANNYAQIETWLLDFQVEKPALEAIPGLLGLLFDGYHFPHLSTKEHRTTPAQRRPLRFGHRMPIYGAFHGIVLPMPVHTEGLYDRFLGILEDMMQEAARTVDPARSFDEQALAVAIWAKSYFTHLQPLVDVNTRFSRLLFQYVLKRTYHLAAGIRPGVGAAPAIDLSEQRWRDLQVRYTFNGRAITFNPFGETIKNAIYIHHVHDLGRFSEESDQPYFIMDRSDEAGSDDYIDPGPLRGQPTLLTVDRWRKILSNRALRRHYVEWETMYQFFDLLLSREGNLSHVVHDNRILAELTAITRELARGGMAPLPEAPL